MGTWGREDMWQGSKPGGPGGGWRTQRSHIHVQISWEEQLGSKIDCTTQGSRKETKASKPLIVKTCGSCSNRRNSQSHRKVCRRGPQDPRMYTSPPIRESAPERAQSTCGKWGKWLKAGGEPSKWYCSFSDPSHRQSTTAQQSGLRTPNAPPLTT